MADKQGTSSETAAEETSQQNQENESPTVEELRQQREGLERKLRSLQSAKDREVAEVRQQNEQLREELDELNERMIELIDDPAAKKDYRIRQLEKQNEALKARQRQEEEVREAVDWWADRFDLDKSVFSSAESPEDVEELAVSAIKKTKEEETSPSPEESGNEEETSSEETRQLEGVEPSPSESRAEREYRERVQEIKEMPSADESGRKVNKGLLLLQAKREYREGRSSIREEV